MLVFFITLVIYLATLFPSVAPYRDTGEMVSVAHTLGIAHPPGYPLYALLSKTALLLLPAGSAGYRLNVLSALAGAATAAIVYRLSREMMPEPAARGERAGNLLPAFTALLFATSYLQWYLSLVSEMYTVNTLFAAALLYAMYRLLQAPGGERFAPYGATAFLFGLGLGNRTDLLLLFPALIGVLFIKRKELSVSRIAGILACFFLGCSVFLFLPVRSSAQPLLDWNHPASIDRLWGSITRKTHGGTLDLISGQYARGENFSAIMAFYFRHLFQGFACAGLPLGALGLYSLWRRKRAFAATTFIAWACSAPVFIYLANMPPNPHALAIVEAHFLLPNLFFFVWVIEGIRFLRRVSGKSAAAPLAGIFVIALTGVNGYTQWRHLNKRENFVAYDYAKNVLRSLPRGAVVVLKKDVQLFSLWNRQLVEGERPDIAVISQGLAASEWYRQCTARRFPGVYAGPLADGAGWADLLAFNPGKEVYFSTDADYRRPQGYAEEPQGLVTRITGTPGIGSGGVLLDVIYPYRGEYRYDAYREFFTPDLIEDYARARIETGRHWLDRRAYEQARYNFSAALALQPLFPAAASFNAFSFFSEGSFARAQQWYGAAEHLYEEYYRLALRYNAGQATRDEIVKDWSDVLVSKGVCAEKNGRIDESLAAYARALEVYPGQAKAYFNRAVINWRKNDWGRVVGDLESALRADPGYREAALYLAQARMKLHGGGK